MKTRLSHRQTANVSHTRWLAYATAGAASALAGSDSAEAAIHYSGLLEKKFLPHKNTIKTFELDQPGDFLKFSHSGTRSSAPAYFGVFGIASAGFRVDGGGFDLFYVSKLSFGQNISAGGFISGTSGYFGLMAFGDSLGRWTEPGIGFVGFKFNNGAGIQYGWARVRMGGFERSNGFKLLDYAYADPGESISAGQKSSAEKAADQGSLGWLALGAVGLLAWRKSRLRTNG